MGKINKLIHGPFVKYAIDLIYSPSETAWFIENKGPREDSNPDIVGPFCHAELKAKFEELMRGIIKAAGGEH